MSLFEKLRSSQEPNILGRISLLLLLPLLLFVFSTNFLGFPPEKMDKMKYMALVIIGVYVLFSLGRLGSSLVIQNKLLSPRRIRRSHMFGTLGAFVALPFIPAIFGLIVPIVQDFATNGIITVLCLFAGSVMTIIIPICGAFVFSRAYLAVVNSRKR